MNIVAPRSVVDFVGKAIIFALVIGLLNYARDVFLGSDAPDSYLNNLIEASVVGTPFILLALALVWHLHQLQLKLAGLATTDMLTGLPNRRGFFDRVTQEGRFDLPGLLLLIDVDHFKKVNDTYGHAVGDLCLQAVARHIRAMTRVEDGIGRYGGEEFVLFLPGAGRDRLDELTRALTSGVLVRVDGSDARFGVTMSVGAVLTQSGSSVDLALARADAALYRAKEQGRARLVLEPRAA